MYQELIITSTHSSKQEALNLLLVDFNCLGSQEFSIDEARVDEILGERSYSGGDIPEDVIAEVERTLLEVDQQQRLYFFNVDEDLSLVETFLKENKIDYILNQKKDQDWNAKWRKHYRPLLISEKLEIVPSWMDEYQSAAQHIVKIYPGQGFGTGSHETTSLCLKLMCDFSIEPKIVLDFGAGSGILGIAAQVLYGSRVDYYDIDENALKNNLQNLEMNNLNENYQLLLPKDRSKFSTNYDLVFANILKPVLELESENLVKLAKVGGLLILSGLLKDQLESVLNTYTDLGMSLVSKNIEGDWGALLLKKLH